MIIRRFNPEKDSVKDLARLNEHPNEWQEWMATQYPAPENAIVAEDKGELVGCIHIFDSGYPWAVIDGWYLKPAYRTMRNARMLGQFAESQLRRRGVKLIGLTASVQMSKVLKRYKYNDTTKEYRFLLRVL